VSSTGSLCVRPTARTRSCSRRDPRSYSLSVFNFGTSSPPYSSPTIAVRSTGGDSGDDYWQKGKRQQRPRPIQATRCHWLNKCVPGFHLGRDKAGVAVAPSPVPRAHLPSAGEGQKWTLSRPGSADQPQSETPSSSSDSTQPTAAVRERSGKERRSQGPHAPSSLQPSAVQGSLSVPRPEHTGLIYRVKISPPDVHLLSSHLPTYTAHHLSPSTAIVNNYR
jgi:hypothetical protein